jgi:gentisate 1,2-dioxygenase
MRGGGATTTVDGRRYPMDEGALVLTPAWSWHDHVHHGDEPMIWLDVLDISLMRSLQASFFEPYRTREQAVADRPQQTSAPSGRELMGRPQLPTPAARGANPLFVYDAAAARSALREAAEFEPDPFDDIVLEYRNPADGGPAMRTLGTRLQQLRRGVRRKARRHTGSKLYYVVQGIGATIVAGETYEWSQGDFLTVAPWAWHEHLNRSDEEDAVLFQVNDIPSMQALGYFREEALTSNGGHQTLADRR